VVIAQPSWAVTHMSIERKEASQVMREKSVVQKYRPSYHDGKEGLV